LPILSPSPLSCCCSSPSGFLRLALLQLVFFNSKSVAMLYSSVTFSAACKNSIRSETKSFKLLNQILEILSLGISQISLCAQILQHGSMRFTAIVFVDNFFSQQSGSFAVFAFSILPPNSQSALSPLLYTTCKRTVH
jgi:hypothetical protein